MFFLPIIIFGIFFMVFLIIGLSIFKSHKHIVEKNKDTMIDIINTISANSDELIIGEVVEDNKQETRICEYCGSSIPVNSAKCDSCGAKIKK